jgi:hypothetical protein
MKTLADFLASTGFYYHCVFLRKEEYDNCYWVTLILKGRAFSFEYFKSANKDCLDVFGGGKEQRPPRLFEVMEWIMGDDCKAFDNMELLGFLHEQLGGELYHKFLELE